MIAIDTSGFKAINVSPAWPEKVFGASAPNILQWTSDTPGKLKGSITDGINTFNNLYPNADGVFSFDLSHFARAKLADIGDLSFRGIPVLVRTEQGFTVEVACTVSITFDDESTENESLETLYFIPAYRQVWNEKKASFFEEAVTEVTDLDPIVDSRALLPTDNVMLFPGYPVDVSIFHYQFDGVEGQPYTLFRYFEGDPVGAFLELSNSIEHEVLTVRMSDWQLPYVEFLVASSGGEYRVKRRVNCFYRESTGIFVSWLNSLGGWSYWLFDGGCVDSYDIQSNGVAGLFTTDPFSSETIKMLPKERQRTINVSTSQIECWMFTHLLDLQVSRNVYIWKRNKGELTPGGDKAWQPVEVSSFTWNPEGGKVKEVFVSLRPQPDYTPQI